MRSRTAVFGFVVLVVLSTISSRSHAQQCAGFDDVPASSGFCPNVIWLKNRGITQGCTATSFCAGTLVSRLSMAAFMKRLGDVVTSNVHSVEATGGSIPDGATQVVCITADIPARDYDRTAMGDATLSYDVTGLADLGLKLVRSTNGGAFTPVHAGVNPWGSPGDRNHDHVMVPVLPLPADPSASYRFGLMIDVGQVASQSISGWSCQLLVTVKNAIQ